MGVVDVHVHCRNSAKVEGGAEYVGHALSVSRRAGVDAVFDMPNTDPPIVSRAQVVERLNAARSYNSDVFYGLHVGLTSDLNQVREAVEIYREFFPRTGDRAGVVGLKMYAGRSVGDLAVVDEEDQRRVYEVLGNENYKGVLVVHCEKEALLRPELWTPDIPSSHSFARPVEAELESIQDQANFFYDSSFNGTLHVAHVSTPKSVDYICNVRHNNVKNMNITCGATPHHLFLNQEMQVGVEGLLWKVNPPLRSVKDQQGLLDCLGTGKIDWIETDHAPHLLGNKTADPYMSGIPGLDSWPKVIKRLEQEGFSSRKIRLLTRDNALRVYRIPEGVIADTSGEGEIDLNEYPYGYGESLIV